MRIIEGFITFSTSSAYFKVAVREFESISVERGRGSQPVRMGASTIVVLEDKPDDRSMLRSLAAEAGLKMIAECSDERNALAVLREAKPTIAIVDVQVRFLNGVEIIRRMHQERPQIRFIASTGNPEDELFDVAMKNGTAAFVLKVDLIHEFHQMITTVVSGHRYISRGALERLLDRHLDFVRPTSEKQGLTARQRNVVSCVAQGLSNKEVGTTLNISESTVEKHRAAAMQRLGLYTAADLVRYAVAARLTETKTPTKH